MGMDVYGRNPKSAIGEYFRSNIWGWPGILDAIADTGVLPEEMVRDMAFNIGAGPDEEQAIALADALDRKLEDMPPHGTFISDDSQYAKMGTATMAKDLLKMVPELAGKDKPITSMRPDTAEFQTEVEFLREFSEFCRNSGGFEVW